MDASNTPPEHWEVATGWRIGGTPTTSTQPGAVAPPFAHGTCSPTSKNGRKEACSDRQGEGDEEVVISLGLLRTCFTERYGSHIPRMFHDLLVDLGQAFLAAREAAARPGALLTPADISENIPGDGDGLVGRGGGGGGGRGKAPVFHVTEYDVIRGRYPQSWEDHAGYIIPGGAASACGNEPWMLTLLDEVQGLRDSGRPVLAFCLGHQVLAQGLGGLVQPRAGTDRHYALQESELLVSSLPPSPVVDAIVGAVAAVRRVKGGGGGEEGEGLPPPPLPPLPLPPLKLLYHHNDEVVKLPPGATNIATSGRCEIHGMMMVVANKAEGSTASQDDAPSSSSSSTAGDPSTPNLLTFQAHPELNYEYGRGVMDGMLDGDIELGRLTHEQAGTLKEQVLAWDHQEFPVALELMRQLFAPIVPRSHGGELQ